MILGYFMIKISFYYKFKWGNNFILIRLFETKEKELWKKIREEYES